MRERCEYILYLLVENKQPWLAKDLAERLSVSPRTIKTEMDYLKSELPKHGAALIARRNFGYALSVTDDAWFQDFYGQIHFKFSVTEKYGQYDYCRVLRLYRHLASVTAPVYLENLADEFSLSRSAMRDYIAKAREFFRSFHLQIQSRPWQGISLEGQESHFRLVLTELYVIHFHLATPEIHDVLYSHWIECDQQERADIRHCFLKVLRESPVSLRDTNSQRLAVYLVIARNRRRSGLFIHLTSDERQAIKECDVYPVAQKVYQQLSLHFEGFEPEEEEICFFAVQLLCYRDMGHLADDISSTPFLAQAADQCADEMLAFLQRSFSLDFSVFPQARRCLKNLLIPIFARNYFHLDGLQSFAWNYENTVTESPLAMEFARRITIFLEKYTGCSVALSDMLLMANYMYLLLSQTEHERKKLRIILVCDSGICFGKRLENRLMARYSHLIEGFDTMELYEARRICFRDYDAVIMDIKSSAYSYPLPWHYFRLLPHKNEMEQIFSHILVYAYQFREHLPSTALIHTYPDYLFTDMENFLQFLSFKHTRDDASRLQFYQYLADGEARFSYYTSSKCAILFGPLQLACQEAIELYELKSPGMWGNNRIHHILYLCIDWKKDWKLVKVIENGLHLLSVYPEYFVNFMDHKEEIFEQLTLDYLKIE